MVALYLDDNLADKRTARQLRAAGHLIYLPVEVGTNGADDSVHLQKAAELGAVLATKDIADFEELHAQWQETSREHAGIIVCRELPIGQSLAYLGRAARLLTAEAARNQVDGPRAVQDRGHLPGLPDQPFPARFLNPRK